MIDAKRIRRATYHVFLLSTGILVVLACFGLWSESDSAFFWKCVGTSALISFSSLWVLGASRLAQELDGPARS